MFTTDNIRRTIALLIGIASITAGVFAWRASQIGSTASFDDRTAIGQTIAAAQRDMEVVIGTSADAADYETYLAAYTIAAELDETTAHQIRSAATEMAVAGGVFGGFELADPAPVEPVAFDVDARLASRTAAAATGFSSGGPLEPDVAAAEADDIRQRVRGLITWAFLVLLAVGALTVAQVADSRRLRRAFAAGGTVFFAAVTIAAFTRDYFAS